MDIKDSGQTGRLKCVNKLASKNTSDLNAISASVNELAIWIKTILSCKIIYNSSQINFAKNDTWLGNNTFVNKS